MFRCFRHCFRDDPDRGAVGTPYTYRTSRSPRCGRWYHSWWFWQRREYMDPKLHRRISIPYPRLRRFYQYREYPSSIHRSIHDYADIVGACTSCLGVSGTVEPATLTVEQMPAHWHSVAVNVFSSENAAPSITSWSAVNSSLDMQNSTWSTGESQSHAHGLGGSTGTANSLPPFFSLSMIMRVS